MQVVILADVWGAVGGIGSLVAAVFALVTIFYARSTVIEARKARTESRDAHAEEMREQSEAIAVAATAHHEEMGERRRALAAEITLQRLGQIERVAETLVDLIRVAHNEAINSPPQIEGATRVRGATLIPSVLARLRANIAILDLLGPGERLLAAGQLAQQAGSLQPLEVVRAALRALDEIESLGRNDANLRLDDAT